MCVVDVDRLVVSQRAICLSVSVSLSLYDQLVVNVGGDLIDTFFILRLICGVDTSTKEH